MEWFTQNKNQSRLGQILVKKKLISDAQLQDAISRQSRTGERLGDILTAWNVVTGQHIEAALRAQRNLRLAASVVTAMLAPLQAYAATPAPAVESSQFENAPTPRKGLVAMDESAMDGVSAQGLQQDLLDLVDKRSSTQKSGAEVLGTMAKLMNPILGFLESDMSIKDVVYDPKKAMATPNPDGSITLSMPSSIGEISFKNIRPVAVGGVGGPSMGSITLSNIQFNDTKVTVYHRP